MQTNKLLNACAQTNQPPMFNTGKVSQPGKQGAGGVKATSTIMGEFMTYRAMYVAAKQALAERLPESITAEQFVVLKMLSAGEIYSDDLAERSGILAPSLSRMLNDLEAIDAISRKQCKTDNRRKLVRILKHGKDLVKAAK